MSVEQAHRERLSLLQEVLGKIEDFRDMSPENDETWENWYFAAFEMLTRAIKEVFERNNDMVGD